MADKKRQQQNQSKKRQRAHRVTITEDIGVTDVANATVQSSTERLAEKYADTLKDLSKT